MISFYAYSTNEPSEGYVHYIIRFQKGCDIIVIKVCGNVSLAVGSLPSAGIYMHSDAINSLLAVIAWRVKNSILIVTCTC